MRKFRLFTKVSSKSCMKRYSSSECSGNRKKGLVLGIYDPCEASEIRLTESALKYDKCVGGKLKELLCGSKIPKRKAHVLGGLNEDFTYIAVAGLGPEGLGYDPAQDMDMCKENIREAAAAGAVALQDMGVTHISVEGFTNAEAAAEGSQLAVWKYQDWKNPDNKLPLPKVELYDSDDMQYWLKGTIATESQNMSRWIAECPSNLMTPALFGQMAVEYLCPCGIEVEIKDRDWMEANRFNAFLSMARGSCASPLFAEINYCGGKQNERPVVLVGKGSTYDSGGLHLQTDRHMSEMRGDVTGAAAVLTAIKAAARLSLPINLTGILAIYENMPSGLALKQGDVVLALNNRTIRVDDPRANGRVVLSDVFSYSTRYRPAFITCVATSADGLMPSLGPPPTGVFTTSDVCWEEIHKAGTYTGDRVWRLPLFKCFRSRVTNFDGVDVVNTVYGKGGGPCLAAAFCMEFCPRDTDLLLLDTSASGGLNKGTGVGYLKRNVMTGRPVRTMVQFLYQLACPNDIKDDC